MQRLSYLLVLAASVLVVVAACNPAPTTDTVIPTDDISGDGGADVLPPDAVESTTVQVGLVEHQIDMPASIPAGLVSFEVTNNSTMEHNFEIEGTGVEEVFATNLQPGETRTLQVELAPGLYEVYCPVEDHADQGMRLQLEVV